MNEQPPSNEPFPTPTPTPYWQVTPPIAEPTAPTRPRTALRYTSIAVAAAVVSGLATVAFEHSPVVHRAGVVNANSGSAVDGGTLNGGTSGLPSTPFDQMNPYSGTVPGYGSVPGYGTVPNYGSGRNRFGRDTNPQSNGSSQSATTGATSAQQVGVVDINTVLDYGTGKAAGTGLVLTSNGEILTNNHVIASATSIKVTVVSTGTTYTARVVGTDVTQDIAVLQLQGASGLTTAHLGNSSNVAVGDAVTGVGNAGGTGGTPSAAAGHVTALDQAITAQDESGGGGERLTGLIETDAAIRAGDSGGPLFDAKDEVVGLDTAASSGGAAEGYAIPINTAVSIATQIEQGVTSSTITQGYPAFLGVQLSSQSAAPLVAGVVADSAAAKVGLTNGDTITKVDGTSITTATQLQTLIAGMHPGDTVRLTWIDASGSTHNATVTLGEGPAQ